MTNLVQICGRPTRTRGNPPDEVSKEKNKADLSTERQV